MKAEVRFYEQHLRQKVQQSTQKASEGPKKQSHIEREQIL